MTKNKLSKMSLIICYIILISAQYTQTAPTTPINSPLSITLILNNTDVTSIEESGKTTIASIHFDEFPSSTSSSIVTEKHQKIRNNDEADDIITKMLPITDKFVKHSSKKQNLKKPKHKISKISLKFEGHNIKHAATTPQTYSTTTTKIVPQSSKIPFSIETATVVSTPVFLSKFIPKDDTTIISSMLSENTKNVFTTQKLESQITLKRVPTAATTITPTKTDQYLKQSITKDKQNGKKEELSTIPSTEINIHEDYSRANDSFYRELPDTFSSRLPLLTKSEKTTTTTTTTDTISVEYERDIKTIDDNQAFSVVKTTTATTTPDYNPIVDFENHKDTKKLNTTDKTVFQEDIKDATINNNNSPLTIITNNANKSAISTTTLSSSDIVLIHAKPLQMEKMKEDESKEKAINLHDVEKIDSESIQGYYQQGQINHTSEQRNSSYGNIKSVNDKDNLEERTIFGSFKKKVGGIVMGHDGVKVTKKKQLMEENFKDDEIMVKTYLMNISKEEKRLSDNENKTKGIENDDGRIVQEIANNMSSIFRRHDDDSENSFSKDNAPIIIREKNILEEGKNDDGTLSLKQNKFSEGNHDLNNKTFPDNFNVEHIQKSIDFLEIETNTRKMHANEKFRSSALKSNQSFVIEKIMPVTPLLPIEVLGTTQAYNNFDAKEVIESTTISENPTTVVSNDDDTTVSRTDVTEPEVVTERSLVSNSFTNVNKNVKVLDVEVLPEEVTSSTSESVPTKHQMNFESISMKGMSYTTTRHKNNIASLVSNTRRDGFQFLTSIPINKTGIKMRTAPIVESKKASDIITSNLSSSKVESKKNAETITFHHIGFNKNTKVVDKQTIQNKNQTDFPGIEIQINVSEGDGRHNSSHHQMLEFSFRKNVKEISLRRGNKQSEFPLSQSDSIIQQEIGLQHASNSELITIKPGDIIQGGNEFLNESDILVVEITDTGNNTDDSISSKERFMDESPKFTIHNDHASDYDSVGNGKNFGDYEIENIKNKPTSRESGSDDDDLFIPDLKLEPLDEFNAGSKKTSKDSSTERDSDTIFYISNTEVKVIESMPTPSTSLNHQNKNSTLQLNQIKNSTHNSHYSRLPPNFELQFFPSIYKENIIINFPNKNSSSDNKNVFGNKSVEQYKEDIILSPVINNFKPLKIISNRTETENNYNLQIENQKIPEIKLLERDFALNNNNMSVTYLGESYIEVEESSSSTNQPPDDNKNDNIQTSSSFIPLNRKEYDGYTTKPPASSTTSETSENPVIVSNVVIQPAILPEISIGVPIIGELPPQIQLKNIDYMSRNNRDFNNENDDGIQYGGDLIANVGGGSNVAASGVGYDVDSEYGFNGIHRTGGASDTDIDKDVAITSQIVMHAVYNLQKDQLVAEVPSGSNIDLQDISASKRNDSNAVNTTMPEKLGNATAYSVLDDNEGDFSFTDVQTLFLACFTTLVPLVLLAVMGYVVRFLWIKYGRHDSQGGSLIGDNSTDPLAAKSMDLSQNELKSTESGITINRSNDTLESSTEIVSKYDDVGGGGGIGRGCGLTQSGSECINGCAVIGGNNLVNSKLINDITTVNNISRSGANGSVITMTLKNNHLIVETEERNDISRDARETKMHYTPSEKDGVFVVKVARGADSKGMPPSSPRNDSNEQKPEMCTMNIETKTTLDSNEMKSSNHEEVEIHQPPPDGNNDEEILIEMNEQTNSNDNDDDIIKRNLRNSNTGLSQSDLSTSSGDSNKGYTYGNQQLYEVNGGYNDEPNLTPAEISSTRPSDNSPNPSNSSPPPPPESNGKLGNIHYSNGYDTISNHNTNNDDDDAIEKKSVTKGALLKQDTVIEVANPVKNLTKTINSKDIENGKHETQQLTDNRICPQQQQQNDNQNENEINTENGFDSLVSLPAPPSTEEIKQMNDIILSENMQLDSLPPPPPPNDISETTICISNGNQNQNGITTTTIAKKEAEIFERHDNGGHSTEEQNGVAVVAVSDSS